MSKRQNPTEKLLRKYARKLLDTQFDAEAASEHPGIASNSNLAEACSYWTYRMAQEYAAHCRVGAKPWIGKAGIPIHPDVAVVLKALNGELDALNL